MKKNNKAYSVIIALLITWFLLLLVVWVLNLVMKELHDTRAMWDYYKAYYWAEAWQELALLKIKEKWYWIDEDIDFTINDKSIVLSEHPDSKSDFNIKKDVYLWYALKTRTKSYTWTLASQEYDIIPLFYIPEKFETIKIDDIDLKINFWTENDLVWNIVSDNWWISWLDEFNWENFVKEKRSNFNLIYENPPIKIKEFLSNSENEINYLILFNSWNNNIIYNITSSKDFTKPRTNIISSAKVWDYKQNLSTKLNNTEYLNILKYSIYSQ